ncbi:hypothetical protein FOMPIDRAFT_1055488 [Fomitopsis schrenkii]|uniref:Uncharacterized protein n=1 Tax=Fomitopsis schrenkii TaxID=2126942 RepID=S8DK52_FOMSC|nr:hypothetical protein FOMPIDRAFT_1055488 [Fomitopsis schrenkii]
MNPIEELLNNTLGCLYLVGVFSVVLYGCTCGQVLYYVTHYIPGDRAHITALVAFLWVLDTAKTMVDLGCGWNLIVLERGNALSLLYKIPATLPGDYAASVLLATGSFVTGIFAGVQVCVVQLCYMHIPFGSHVKDLRSQNAGRILNALPNSHIAGSLRPACSAAVDIYITVWLCYHLQDAKTPESKYKVTKLFNYAVTRGIVTS